MKVLVVEDDRKVASFLSRVLTEEGWTVDTCASGAEAVPRATTGPYDVVVLDWMLPDIDGVTVCREIRAAGATTPVLMLTARGELRERVLGLDAGADDYLVKPFEIEELLARLRALVRRAVPLGRLRCGDLDIDRVGHKVTLLGASIDLTTREYALLAELADNAGKVLSRAELLTRVWKTTFDPGTNLVEVHVSRLREKLGAHAWMIETVRGAGYRLRTTLGDVADGGA